MYVVYGSKLYGKVDEIEGVGHVATEFGHIFWIPLVPKASFFVYEKDWRSFQGTEIPFHMKSVLVGYARAAAFVFLFAALGALGQIFDPAEAVNPDKINSLKTIVALGVMSIPGLIYFYSQTFTKADYTTAAQLARSAGFDEQLQTYVELLYDRIDSDEAERRMALSDPESVSNPAAVEQYPTFGEDFSYEQYKQQYA